jgi:uncharacterized protein involved in exopolysaccharide biosynthesis
MSITQLPDPYARRPIQLTEAFAPHPEADSFDFRRTLMGIQRSWRNHRLLIALTCVLTIAITEAYMIIWPPVYVADVMLIAESDKDQSKDDFYSYWHMFRKDRLADEVQLFTAPTVLTEVIHRLNLKYDDVYHSFFSYATHLWQISWPGRAWHGLKEWVWPRRHGPYDPTPEQVEFARTLTEFKTGVAVDAVADTDVGRLVVRGPSARVAEMANTIAQVYLTLRLDRQRDEAEKAYQALLVEVDKARTELRTVEARVQKYYSDNDIFLNMDGDKLDVGQLSALRGTIADLKAAIAANTDTLAQVNTLLAGEQREVVSSRLSEPTSIHTTLTDKLAELTLAEKQMQIHYKPDAPEVTELQRQMAVVKDQLARQPGEHVAQTTTLLNSVYESLRGRKAQLEEDLAGQNAALAAKQKEEARLDALVVEIPRKMVVSHDLERETQIAEKRFVLLNDKLTEADVSRAMALSAPTTIKIVEPAVAPDEPVWPITKLLLAAAAGVGLLAGLGLALLIDLLSGRVDRYRLESGEAGVPLYAILTPTNLFAAQLFPSLTGPAEDKS